MKIKLLLKDDKTADLFYLETKKSYFHKSWRSDQSNSKLLCLLSKNLEKICYFDSAQLQLLLFFSRSSLFVVILITFLQDIPQFVDDISLFY